MSKTPQKGAAYRHYKGTLYEIVEIGRIEERPEQEVVIYRDLSDSTKVWVRPLESFMDIVKTEGRVIPRFSIVREV